MTVVSESEALGNSDVTSGAGSVSALTAVSVVLDSTSVANAAFIGRCRQIWTCFATSRPYVSAADDLSNDKGQEEFAAFYLMYRAAKEAGKQVRRYPARYYPSSEEIKVRQAEGRAADVVKSIFTGGGFEGMRDFAEVQSRIETIKPLPVLRGELIANLQDLR
jgi:hypothetical protein